MGLKASDSHHRSMGTDRWASVCDRSDAVAAPSPRNPEIEDYGKVGPLVQSRKKYNRADLGFENSPWRTFWLRIKVLLTLAYCRTFRKSRPVIVVLTVNSNCNWNCVYCYGDYPTKGTEKNLSTEDLIKLIDDLAEMGCCYMLVHGGEALLRKDIGYIIDYIKTKGIYVCLVTNGQIFPKRIDELRNIDNLTISLDGRPENNDKNRGLGSYDYAIAAIRLALKERFKVRVSCTLTKHSKNDIPYMAELAKEVGFPVSFSILFRTDFTKSDDPLALTGDEIRQCLRTIKNLKHQGYPLFTSNANLDYALRWPYERFNKLFLSREQVPKDFKPLACYNSKLMFHAEGDGRMMPCTILSSNQFDGKDVRVVGTREAIRHVQDTNKCVACPHLSQNEWNLLMGMSPRVIAINAYEQLKELTRWY